MNNEKWTIKLNGLNGKSSGLVGNKRGNEVNDLDKIASRLGTKKDKLLNSDIIKDIRIERIKIRHGDYLDSIQFFYKVKTNDKTYSIEGNQHGGNGGKETTINLEADEYIWKIEGKQGESSHGNIDQLNLTTFILSKKQIKKYGDYGGRWNTTPFSLSPTVGTVYTCFFGRSTDRSLTGVGFYEGKAFSTNPQLEEQVNNLNQQIQKFRSQLSQEQTTSQDFQQQNVQITNQLQQKTQNLDEIFNLVFPGNSYNFNQLKTEIARLKHQELAPQVRSKRTELEQLIVQVKNKVGNSEAIIGLLLETQRQIIQTAEASQREKLNGKAEAYQSILESSLSSQELQTLLDKQTELYQLEKHLESLKSR